MSEQGLLEAGPCHPDDGEWCCHVVYKRMMQKDIERYKTKLNKILTLSK